MSTRCSGFSCIAGIVISLLIGLFFLVATFMNKRREGKMQKWTSVKGEITNTDIYSAHAQRSSDARFSHLIWHFRVEYKYTVNGVEFSSTHISNKKEIASEPAIESNLDEIPSKIKDLDNTYFKGRRVEVTFNPNNPGDAFLESDPSNTSFWFLLITGIVFTGIGVLFICMYFKPDLFIAKRSVY